MILPEPIQNVVNALARLPGIGPKTASRLAFYLLRAPQEVSQDLAEALMKLKSSTSFCPVCFNITLAGRSECEICASMQPRPGLDLRGRRAAGCDCAGADGCVQRALPRAARDAQPDRRDRAGGFAYP